MAYLIEVYIPATEGARSEYYFPEEGFLWRIPAPENQAIAKRWARRTTTRVRLDVPQEAPARRLL
jgi:hypothetical protein